MSAIVWAFLVCAALAAVLTPLVRAISLRIGAVEAPGSRSLHVRPLATLGGVALLIAFGIGVWRFAWTSLGGDGPGLLAGAAATVAVGLLDDLAKCGRLRLGRLGDAEGRGLRPLWKVAGQLAAATLAVLLGVNIQGIHNPFSGGYLALGAWGLPATVLWIFLVSTVVNLVDGLDGLAAGVVAIAAGTLLVVSLDMGEPAPAAVLSAIVLGASLGFLPWNWSPARIIMGDAGALFLGYALAAVSVEGTLKSPAAIALAVSVVLALGLPVLDTGFAVLRRWRLRQPIGRADRDHLHHRLLAMGWSQRDTALVIYIVTGWLAISAIALDRMGWLAGVLVVAFVVSSLVYIGRRTGLLVPARSVAEVAASKGASQEP